MTRTMVPNGSPYAPIIGFSRAVRVGAVVIFATLLAVVALYWQWRSSLATSGPAAQADTMCVASRIGLPCQPDF